MDRCQLASQQKLKTNQPTYLQQSNTLKACFYNGGKKLKVAAKKVKLQKAKIKYEAQMRYHSYLNAFVTIFFSKKILFLYFKAQLLELGESR